MLNTSYRTDEQMTPLRDFHEPDAREAQENLRMIRELMERPTQHSTFSGASGVLAGLASIVGCVVTRALQQRHDPSETFACEFVLTWSLVILTAIGADYLLNKRKAVAVGKHIRSRLGKQMMRACAPGLGTGGLLTIYFLQKGMLESIYPVWMLCYGLSVCAVGLFSQREVTYLGLAFLLAGAATLLLFPALGLPLVAVTFGGFHIVYGVAMARRDGW